MAKKFDNYIYFKTVDRKPETKELYKNEKREIFFCHLRRFNDEYGFPGKEISTIEIYINSSLIPASAFSQRTIQKIIHKEIITGDRIKIDLKKI